MIYIETHSTDAAFNFACEEYCMKKFKGYPKVMLTWQADNCAMVGRYQVAQIELNHPLIKELGTKVVRRNTGGGTIYTDLGNLLYTFIMPVTDTSKVDFATVCQPVVTALNKMGVPAELKGRNDIIIEGKKISGNAQAISNHTLCSHGSLLYNADLDRLQELLIVDDAKFKSKGIASIRSGVTNIVDYMPYPYSVERFWTEFKEAVLEGEDVVYYEFTEDDIKEIEEICCSKYNTWAWNYGNAPEFNYANEIRFSMGKIAVYLQIRDGVIKFCRIGGDFLGLIPIEPLEVLLEGTAYSYGHVENRLKDVQLDMYLRGISKDDLLQCVFG